MVVQSNLMAGMNVVKWSAFWPDVNSDRWSWSACWGLRASIASPPHPISTLFQQAVSGGRTFDDLEELVDDWLGEGLAVERVEEHVEPPLRIVDHLALRGLCVSRLSTVSAFVRRQD